MGALFSVAITKRIRRRIAGTMTISRFFLTILADDEVRDDLGTTTWNDSSLVSS